MTLGEVSVFATSKKGRGTHPGNEPLSSEGELGGIPKSY